MSSLMSLEVLRQRMAESGVDKLYAKFLSPNDNSKNQVYLGGGFGVLNVLPAGAPVATTSGSYKKPIFQAQLNLRWLDESGSLHQAPEAKLILYPQYPEVRMSGYLRGAAWAPSDVMGTTRDEGRVLLLGVRCDRTVIAYACDAHGAVAKELEGLRDLESVGVLLRVPLKQGENSEKQLLAALCAISRKEWIPSMRLNAARELVPCPAPNCGGYTLEAQLDIVPNGRAEPDYLGWEVKSYTVKDIAKPVAGPITLMTPEPTGGFYREEGVAAFVRRFGYPDMLGRPNRLNFGGRHFVGTPCAATGLTLRLDGFDASSGKITDAGGRFALVAADDVVAAEWSFAGMLAHWNRKHAATVFVPTQRQEESGLAFHYGERVSLGTGADFLRVLGAFAVGSVYYDPGIKLVTEGQVESTKRRSQFRIQFKNLATLYDRFRTVGACTLR